MTSNHTIRLLILNDSRAEAERLISMLQNSGHPTRAQHVESEEGLVKLLQEQSWDLTIGFDNTENVTPATAVKHIRRLGKDVPVVLLTDDEGSKPIVEGIKLGACDVVRLDEDQHLLQVINRELTNRSNRGQQRFAERRVKDIERRNQQLLDSSRFGIAFVQDGMFLYANQSFAEVLGHPTADEIECMPVIDTVREQDQGRVKEFLKGFMLRGSDVEASNIEVGLITADESSKQVAIEIRKAQYEDETCIQFLIRNTGVSGTSPANNEQLQAQLQKIRHQDLATGLFNKNYLIEHIESTVDKAVASGGNAALMCIQINNFVDVVQNKVGLASADIVLGTIAEYAKTQLTDGEILCRFSEENFMLLNNAILPDPALERAIKLADSLSSHIIDIDGATLQFMFKIGVASINETTSSSDTPITQALQAVDALKKDAQGDNPVLAKIFEVETPKDGHGRTTKEVAKMVQQALDGNRFRLLFQPILSLRGSDKEHYEVLLRMIDDDGNGVSPDEFLAVAAEIGATAKIDRWVILEAIKLLSKHRQQDNNTRLIINLSRESIKDNTLPPWLGVAFKAAKLPPSAIIFQINESVANDHLNLAKAFTEQVSALGCEISLTHFGCTLNPFNALQHLTTHFIKVDGSFTRELQNANGEPAALNDLVTKLHEHEKITIVPFVENAGILSKLWQSGVHYIQGYYLQGPAESMDYDFDTES